MSAFRLLIGWEQFENPAISPNFEIEPMNIWADNFHRFAIVSLEPILIYDS